MNLKRLGSFAALAAAGALALAGCAANEPGPGDPSDDVPTLTGTINGSGASAQGTAQQAWTAGFQVSQPGVTINYDGGGSGTGREAFYAGAVDFAGTDRAIRTTEIDSNAFEACVKEAGIIQLPLYISPIAVGYTLSGVSNLQLDADTLAKIFTGAISKWNDPALVALNPGVSLPDLDITPVHRSDNSGTTENFVDYLSKTAGDVWTHGVSGDWPTGISGGEAANGTGGVADAIRAAQGTIGYLDASRATGMGTASIKVGNVFVPYSPAAAAAVIDASPRDTTGRTTHDIVVNIDRTTTAAGAYPLVLISYISTCADFKDDAKAALVKAYLTYIASEEGQAESAEKAGSAPISSALRTPVVAAINSIK